MRGGVYWARLHEAGDRPVVVISWNTLATAIRKPIVCQVTTIDRERAFPTTVRLEAGEAGLVDESFALCHEIASVRAERFRAEIGHLSDDRMAEIEQALGVALDLGGALPTVRP